MTEYKLSIITPTYNRGHLLGNLYKSLCSQTNKRFEWIIIDDGSVDNTEKVVKEWQSLSDINFEIKYIKQKNGGKHRALNHAVPKAQYEYVYIIDSDDYMVNSGVEKIYRWIESINGKLDFAGVSGLRGKNSEKTILGEFPENKEFVDASNIERKKYKLLGDKAEIYRKDILLKYPFPEFEGENFIGESASWNKIAMEGFKIRWFGEIICVCNYLEDGLTKSMGHQIYLENFNGYTYVEKLNMLVGVFPSNYLAIGRYTEVARKKKIRLSEIKDILDVSLYQVLLGALLYKARNLARMLGV